MDIFYFMHYQPSFEAGEGPRLSPPESAVPWFPVPAPTKTGAELFAINCAMCHGQEGKGDGLVLRILEAKYAYRPAVPPDLTSDFVQVQSSDDVLLNIISRGLVVMPPFEKLLSEEERRLLLDHIRSLVARE